VDYASILDSLPDAVFIHDAASGQILAVNQACLAMFGYLQGAIPGLDLERLSSGEPGFTRQDGLARIEEAKRLGRCEFPWRSRRADGSLFWSEVRLTHLPGQAEKVIAVVRDVTAVTQAEEALRWAEEKYEKVFRANPASILLARFPEGRVEEANETVLRLTGYTREELLGRFASDLWLEPEVRERYMERLRSEGRVTGFEARFRMKSGDVKVGKVSAEFLDLPDGRRVLTLIEDLTEQRRWAEKALVASEQWQATFDAAGDAITLLDPQGRVLRRNLASERLAQRGDGDPATHCPADFQALRGRTGLEFLCGGLTYDVTLDPLRARDGSLEGVVHIARDVTGRKAAEGALRRMTRLYEALSRVNHSLIRVRSREELFRSICRALVEGGGFWAAWIAEPDPETGRFRALALEGGTDGWVEGLRVSVDPALPEGRGTMGRAYREQRPVIANDFDRDAVTAPWRDEGRTRGFRAAASFPLRDGNRAVFGVLCIYALETGFFGRQELGLLDEVCQAVTYALADLSRVEARAQAEREKDDLRELLQSIIDSTPDLVYAKDMRQAYLLVNRSMAEFLGREPEAIIGHRDSEFWPEGAFPGTGAQARVEIRAWESEALWGDVVVRETAMVPPGGGEPRLFDSLMAPLRDASGAIGGLLGYARDITWMKRQEAQQRDLEARLHQTQKLESLGNLAGGVAHDINNVLGAILGLASIEQERAQPGSSSRRSMDTIVQACVRGREVVQGLLCFARRDLGAIEQVDLNGLVKEIVGLLGHTTLQRVRFITDLDPALPWIQGDPGSLNHALMNICVNAVDAMPGGGTLTLRTRAGKDGRVEVSVEDTGEGMDPEVAQRATEPFFTTKPSGKGTGLGLSMAYGTVQAHKGTLTIESSPGRGTVVRLAFPEGSGAPRSVAAPVEAPTVEGLRILLVDDDELLRESVSDILTWQGHRAECAGGGQEALDALASGADFDLVILDLNMPGMSGAETLPRILEMRPGQRILVSSGYSEGISASLLEGRPMVHTLDKPFTSKELARKIADLLKVPPSSGSPRA
jgi:PAS domain S-box-containing protein